MLLARLYLSLEQWFIPTIDYCLSLYKTNWDTSSTSRQFLLWWKWLAPLEVQPLSRDKFQCTPVYIDMSLCIEVCMANVSSGIPLIWGVNVLHHYMYNTVQDTIYSAKLTYHVLFIDLYHFITNMNLTINISRTL